MNRYVCEDCKELFRSSDVSRVRCRKCLHRLVGSEANRPNRSVKSVKTIKTIVNTPPKVKREKRK
jgi:DNA-directed RNA polymerase subunit RPC12/RpoP